MKCLICGKELKNGVKRCPICGFSVGKQDEKDFKKEEMFAKNRKSDKEQYNTIVLLQEELNSIKSLLDEDEKKNKSSNTSKKKNSKKKDDEKDKYNTIILLQDQLNTIRELLDEDDKKKKTTEKGSKNKKGSSKKVVEEKVDYNTIVLLQEQLNDIRTLLDEDEKKEQKKKKTKNSNTKKNNNSKNNVKKNDKKVQENKDVLSEINIDSTSKKELEENIQNVEKELEQVNRDIEENEEFINIIRSEEKEYQENEKAKIKEPSIEEKILMTAPIDKIADAIAGEIKEEIENANHPNIDIDIQDESEKTKEFEVDLGKTIAINSLGDTKELDKFSLIDDINNQIESVNEESLNNVQIFENQTIDNTDDNVVTRKKVFVFTGIAMLLLLFMLVSIWLFTGNNKDNGEAKLDRVNQMSLALQKYYETNDIDSILFVLEEVKNDKEEVKKLQAKTRNICDSWVLLYLNEEVENKDKFEKATVRYKGLLEGLYRYAIVKNDSGLVRALTEKDYNDLLIQFDDIYSDSAVFYDALELYNMKDYNKAYYMLERIESTNSYYDKSVTYSNLIISNILETIKKDIDLLEANIDELDDASKLEVYTNIEQIIIDYNSIYSNIDLTQNDDYQKYLSKYTSKVSEYTDKVLKDFNSQGSVT